MNQQYIKHQCFDTNPENIYMFKTNNRNTKKRCEICLKLTVETLEQCQR